MTVVSVNITMEPQAYICQLDGQDSKRIGESSQEENSPKWLNVTFEERLKSAFRTDDLNEIAEKLGKSYQGIYHYIKGKRRLSDKLLVEISRLTNCSIHWLLLEEGPADRMTLLRVSRESNFNATANEWLKIDLEPRIKEHVEKLAEETAQSPEDQATELIVESLIARGVVTNTVEGTQLIFFGEHSPRLVTIPLLGEIAAGRPLQVFEEAEEIEVAEDFIVPGRRTYALRVRGDSMIEESILDGDIIIIIEASEANPGESVVALVDGDKATVKQFYRRGKFVVLRSANREHKDIILPADRVVIQGIVIGIQRRK